MLARSARSCAVAIVAVLLLGVSTAHAQGGLYVPAPEPAQQKGRAKEFAEQAKVRIDDRALERGTFLGNLPGVPAAGPSERAGAGAATTATVAAGGGLALLLVAGAALRRKPGA